MNISNRWQRLAFFGALLASVLALAVLANAAMPQQARADAPPDTKLTVKVHGPVGPGWVGTIGSEHPDGGIAFHTLWSSIGIGNTANTGTLTGLGYGLHGVAAADPIAPGWTEFGYAAFPSNEPDPQCPESIHAYVNAGTVTLTAQQPYWTVCVRVAPVTEVPGTSIAIHSVSTPWGTGMIDGPSTYDMTWGFLHPYTILGLGGRPWVPVGVYTFTSDVPPFGTYARMVALDGYSNWDECPVDAADYINESVTFEVSLAHPNWMVCVMYFDVPITVSTDPGPQGEWTVEQVPTQPPAAYDVPEIIEGFPVADPEPVADVPPTQEPEPAVEETPTPSSEPPTPTETAVADAPVDPVASSDVDVAPSATPLPPATGDTLASGQARMLWFEAALILVALATAGLAAGGLPSRRKR